MLCFGGGSMRKQLLAEENSVLQHMLLQEHRDRLSLQHHNLNLHQQLLTERAKNEELEREIHHAAQAAQEMENSLTQYFTKQSQSGGSTSTDTHMSQDQLRNSAHLGEATSALQQLPYTVTSPDAMQLLNPAIGDMAAARGAGPVQQHSGSADAPAAASSNQPPAAHDILQAAMHLRGYAEACLGRLSSGGGSRSMRSSTASGAFDTAAAGAQGQQQPLPMDGSKAAAAAVAMASAAAALSRAHSLSAASEGHRSLELPLQALQASHLALQLGQHTTEAGGLVGAPAEAGAVAGDEECSVFDSSTFDAKHFNALFRASSCDPRSSYNSWHPSLRSSQQSQAALAAMAASANAAAGNSSELGEALKQLQLQLQDQQQQPGSRRAQRCAITRGAAALAGSCASIAAAAAATAAASAARKASQAAAMVDAQQAAEAAGTGGPPRPSAFQQASLVPPDMLQSAEWAGQQCHPLGHANRNRSSSRAQDLRRSSRSSSIVQRQQWQQIQEQWDLEHQQQEQQQQQGVATEAQDDKQHVQHDADELRAQRGSGCDGGSGEAAHDGSPESDAPNLGSPRHHASNEDGSQFLAQDNSAVSVPAWTLPEQELEHEGSAMHPHHQQQQQPCPAPRHGVSKAPEHHNHQQAAQEAPGGHLLFQRRKAAAVPQLSLPNGTPDGSSSGPASLLQLAPAPAHAGHTAAAAAAAAAVPAGVAPRFSSDPGSLDHQQQTMAGSLGCGGGGSAAVGPLKRHLGNLGSSHTTFQSSVYGGSGLVTRL